MTQGRTPVPDRPGRGRRRLLSGSGGRHHRAHPAVHPGGGGQHLQRHVDEPQFRSPDACAAQLVCPSHEVRTQEHGAVATKQQHY